MNKIHLRSESGFYLHVKVIENNARADGIAENIIEVYCMDDDYYPVRSQDILMTLSGNALFKRNGQAYDHSFTDPYGVSRISIINKVPEEVEFTAQVSGEKSTKQVIPIDFIINTNTLKISQVVNANKKFNLTGQPTTAWSGAFFYIETTGGSGSVDWKVIQSFAEVTIQSDSLGRGLVIINARPRQICLIEGTDRVTKEKVTYNFQITNFVNTEVTRRGISETLSIYGYNILSIGEYNTLFNQWGNLRKYDPWARIVRSHHWTNDNGFWSTTCFNIYDGTKEDFMNIEPKNVTYRVGSY